MGTCVTMKDLPAALVASGAYGYEESVAMASQFDQGRQSNQVGQPGNVKNFPTGATRSADTGKNHYDGFLSFPAIQEFGDYMTRHRVQPDGALRDPDNWQKGIPISSYVGSLLRHALELWGLHRGYISRRLTAEYPNRDIEFLKRETACACWFNIQGFLHETLRQPTVLPFLGKTEVYDPSRSASEQATTFDPDDYWGRLKKQLEAARANGDSGQTYQNRQQQNAAEVQTWNEP